MAQADTITVFGGSGFFGSLVVEDLRTHGTELLRIAGRRPASELVLPPGVEAVRCDQRDRQAVRGVLAHTDLVIHAAGPYQGLEPVVAEEAVEAGVPYVDLADDAGFVRRVHGLHRRALDRGAKLLCGLSAVPGLAALLVEALRETLDSVDSVRSVAAPGTRSPRGAATFASLLSGVGRPVPLPRSGKRVPVRGWSEPEWVEFPLPLGRRLSYVAIEVADLDLFPLLFGAKSVEFRACADRAWLGRALALVSRVGARLGGPSLARLGGTAGRLLRIVAPLGTDAGGFLVEVRGRDHGTPRTRRIAIVAGSGGGRIPAVPAALAARALLDGEIAGPGVVPLSGWIPGEQLFAALAARGLAVWRADGDGGWQAVVPAGTITA